MECATTSGMIMSSAATDEEPPEPAIEPAEDVPEEEDTELSDQSVVIKIPTAQEKCVNCMALKKENTKLNKSVKTLRAIATKRRGEIRKLRKKGKLTIIPTNP